MLLRHGDPIEGLWRAPRSYRDPIETAATMSAQAQVQARGRALEDRLLRVPGHELLAGLREAGALGPTEEAALGPPGGRGWVRRLRALALARGEESCRALLYVLASLEEPGPLDFYNPRRDAQPSHRSDCPCCHPPREDGGPKDEDGGPKDEDGGPKDEDEGLKDEEGPEEEEEKGEEEGGGLEEEEGAPEEEEGDEDGGSGEEGDGEEGDGDLEEEVGGSEEDGDAGGEDGGPEEEDAGGDTE
ncbi:major centromere autoantigen B-like [Cygnus olor]|uniref:major centromere autoantigen B-like n=1 Tax=Cygnus olor TaxID=8869 RepID=UPI001ADE2226|nr:major centromere autoantigen B-like [Cygnus olor]